MFHAESGLIESMAKKRVGRPSLYKPEFAELARKLRLFGATDEQIAWFSADNIKKGAKVGCA